MGAYHIMQLLVGASKVGSEVLMSSEPPCLPLAAAGGRGDFGIL